MEIFEIAKIAPEQRQKTYSLGEKIEIRGAGWNVYYITIISLEEIGNNFYTLKYSLTPNASDEVIKYIFRAVGAGFNEYTFITNSIIFEAVRSQILEYIVLTGPDFPELTYKVVIN